MFKHILIPTDFGEPSRLALQHAIGLAQKLGAKLTMLHVYGIPTVYYPDNVSWPLEELGKAAQATLDVAVADARKVLPQTEGRVEIGDPRDRILAYAKQSGADLIVIGTHGRRGVAHMVLGSVAEWVVRMSPIPVLTVSAHS
jgi:nucleotide-binding universal stress UspA family protein